MMKHASLAISLVGLGCFWDIASNYSPSDCVQVSVGKGTPLRAGLQSLAVRTMGGYAIWPKYFIS